MARKKKKDDGGGGAYWMDTYGDLVTNLLCFFVLLYAFSSVDEGKWQALVAAFAQTPTVQVALLDSQQIIEEFQERMTEREMERLREMAQQLGLDEESYEVTPEMAAAITEMQGGENGQNAQGSLGDSTGSGDTISNIEGGGIAEISSIRQEFDDLYYRMQAYVTANALDNALDLERVHDEITLRFKDNLLFDSGRAELKPEALGILDDISGLLQESEKAIKRVRVEGHADNVPIRNSRYANNMELSVWRAMSVYAHMRDSLVLPRGKLSTAGFGEDNPIDTNETAEGRAHNRRVELVIERQNIYIPISSLANSGISEPLPEGLSDFVE